MCTYSSVVQAALIRKNRTWRGLKLYDLLSIKQTWIWGDPSFPKEKNLKAFFCLFCFVCRLEYTYFSGCSLNSYIKNLIFYLNTRTFKIMYYFKWCSNEQILPFSMLSFLWSNYLKTHHLHKYFILAEYNEKYFLKSIL